MDGIKGKDIILILKEIGYDNSIHLLAEAFNLCNRFPLCQLDECEECKKGQKLEMKFNYRGQLGQ